MDENLQMILQCNRILKYNISAYADRSAGFMVFLKLYVDVCQLLQLPSHLINSTFCAIKQYGTALSGSRYRSYFLGCGNKFENIKKIKSFSEQAYNLTRGKPSEIFFMICCKAILCHGNFCFLSVTFT
jgi:hypothetical protein